MVRILYAEDHVEVRNALKRRLQGDGYDVVAVCDGREAANLLNDGQKFDVLITDGKMPAMTGYALLREPGVLEIPLRILLSAGCGVPLAMAEEGHWKVSKIGGEGPKYTLSIIRGECPRPEITGRDRDRFID